MDGDLLLNVTDQDLSADLGMTAALTRKRQVEQTPQETCLRLSNGNTSVLSPQPGF